MFWIVPSNIIRVMTLGSLYVFQICPDSYFIWLLPTYMAAIEISTVSDDRPGSTLTRSGQNGGNLADNIFQMKILAENFFILIKFSLKFVHKDPTDNKSALVQVMAWCLNGTKPLPEPMTTQFTDASRGLNELIHSDPYPLKKPFRQILNTFSSMKISWYQIKFNINFSTMSHADQDTRYNKTWPISWMQSPGWQTTVDIKWHLILKRWWEF